MRDWLRRHHWDIYYEQLPLISAMLSMCWQAALQTVVKRKGTLDLAAIGHEHFDKSIPITKEKIKLFAKATNETNPLYLGEPQIAPPMIFPVWSIHSMMKLFTSEHLNLDFAGMFHAGQDAEFIRLVRPGDRIRSKSFVKKIVDKGKGEILVTNTYSYDDKDEVVFRGYSSWYVKKPKQLQTQAPEEFREQLYWEPETDNSVRFLERMTIASDQMLRYAKISGDYNFIHISDLMAKLFGGKRKILQGLCLMAFMSKALVDGLLGGNPHRLKRLNARFLNNVSSSDVLNTSCWEIDPAKVKWSSFWLDKKDTNSRIIGFKTINQHGDVIVSRGVAKIEM